MVIDTLPVDEVTLAFWIRDPVEVYVALPDARTAPPIVTPAEVTATVVPAVNVPAPE
jgi:hypothetical protein